MIETPVTMQPRYIYTPDTGWMDLGPPRYEQRRLIPSRLGPVEITQVSEKRPRPRPAPRKLSRAERRRRAR